MLKPDAGGDAVVSGAPRAAAQRAEPSAWPAAATPASDATTRSRAAARLSELLGVDPRAAALAIGVDLLLTAVDASTLGLSAPLGVVAAAALSVAVYRMQLDRHGDDRRTAMAKAAVIGLLTAIPMLPITPLLALPGGLVGLLLPDGPKDH